MPRTKTSPSATQQMVNELEQLKVKLEAQNEAERRALLLAERARERIFGGREDPEVPPSDYDRLYKEYWASPENREIVKIREEQIQVCTGMALAFRDVRNKLLVLTVQSPAAQTALKAMDELFLASAHPQIIRAHLSSAPQQTAYLASIVGQVEAESGVQPRQRKSASKVKGDPAIDQIDGWIGELLKGGRMSTEAICEALGERTRPKDVEWSHLDWPQALLDHSKAVRTWISRARGRIARLRRR